jgi:chaperonin cofactor prefoldin
MQNSKNAMESEFQELQQKFATNESAMAEQNQTIEEYKEKLETADSDLQALQEVNENLQMEHSKVSNSNTTLTANCEAYKLQIGVLEKTANDLHEQLNELRSKIVPTQHRRPNDNFPTVQKIIQKFAHVGQQKRTPTMKKLKKYLAWKDKTFTSLYIAKMASKVIFNLLIACYQQCNQYLEKIIREKMIEAGIDVTETDSDNKNDNNSNSNSNSNAVSPATAVMNYERNQTYLYEISADFEALLDAQKKDMNDNTMRELLEENTNMNDNCKKSLSDFVDEAIYVCWCVTLCYGPQLAMIPLKFEGTKAKDLEIGETADGSNNNSNAASAGAITSATSDPDLYSDDEDDDEDGDGDNKTPDVADSGDDIEYDENRFNSEYGSHDDEVLNYITWPALYNVNTKKMLSKIHAVFLDEIEQLK